MTGIKGVKKKSIYIYITVPLLSVVILIGVLTNMIIYQINSRIVPQIQSLMLDSMTSKANEISLWIDTRIKEVEYLEETIDWLDFSIQKKDIWMNYLSTNRYQHSRHYETIGFVSEAGINYVNDGSVFYVRDREYMQRIMKPEAMTVVSNPIISKGNEKKIILIVTEIIDNYNVFKGYLTCAISSDYLEQVLRQANTYDFPCYIINEEDQTIIAGTKDETINPSQSEMVKVKIPATSNWSIVVQIPHEEMNMNVRETIGVTILLSILTIGGMVLVNQKYNRHITGEIKRLQEHMEKIREGKFVKIIPDGEVEEFYRLGNSYNEMITNIERLIKQVEEQQKLKREAENKALYAQIKPHFLYNTLETIQAMAFNNDDEPVEEAISNLATLFRMSLTSSSQIITLQEEMMHLESYLKIQLLRYTKNFDYVIEQENIDLKVAYMKFTLQPLVENAIYHGVRLMGHKGRIVVRIKEIEDTLIAEVVNTYQTIDKERIQMINEQLQHQIIYGENYSGHGLYNVNERLKINFGQQYGVSIGYTDEVCIVKVIHPKIKEI